MRITSNVSMIFFTVLIACVSMGADHDPSQPASQNPALPGGRLPTAQVTIAAVQETVGKAGDLYIITSSDSQPDLHGESAWEIRAADNSHRIARIEISQPIIGGGDRPFSAQTLARMGAIPDGDYVLAWTIAGRRSSNVIEFHIDGKFDPKHSPILQLDQIEATGMKEFPRLVIRAARPTKNDPAWFPSQLAFPMLSFDGDEKSPMATPFTGPGGPMPVGGSDAFIVDFRSYADLPLRPGSGKPLRIGQAYQIVAIISPGRRRSNAITLSYKHPLADTWDKATASIKDAPLPPPSLFGTIVGPDGKPARHYEVYAEKGKDRRQVFTDADGNYEFRGLPPGKYTVFANAFQSGNPQFTASEVSIDSILPRQLAISFLPNFRISGRVTHKDGSPAAHWTVMSSWDSPDGKEEYDISAKTDAAGRYTVAAPFGKADFIGWGGDQVKNNVPAGSERVDFVADDAK